MDPQHYLNRINYSGDLQPTLDTLSRLQRSHLLYVPFENLDIHLGRTIELDPERFYKKVVENGRGGFCYELNGLYNELLRAIGFDTRLVSARVYSEQNGFGPEFDHLAILVTIDGESYISDVGFGEFSLEPVTYELDTMQHHQRGDYLITSYDEMYYCVSKQKNGQTFPQYIFSTQERQLADFSEMCRYHQTSPDSNFTQKRFISRPTEDGGRISLYDLTLKFTMADGTEEEHPLEDDTAFHNKLWAYFGLVLR